VQSLARGAAPLGTALPRWASVLRDRPTLATLCVRAALPRWHSCWPSPNIGQWMQVLHVHSLPPAPVHGAGSLVNYPLRNLRKFNALHLHLQLQV